MRMVISILKKSTFYRVIMDKWRFWRTYLYLYHQDNTRYLNACIFTFIWCNRPPRDLGLFRSLFFQFNWRELYLGTPPSREKPVGPYPFVVEQTSGKKVLVVQDYTYGKYLGFLQVVFDDDGEPLEWEGNPILLNESILQGIYCHDPTSNIKSIWSFLGSNLECVYMYCQGCHNIPWLFHDHITKFHDLYIDIHVGWILKRCRVAAPIHEN